MPLAGPTGRSRFVPREADPLPLPSTEEFEGFDTALPDAMAPPPRDAAYMLLARTPAAAKDASAPPAANVELSLVVLVGLRRGARERERPVLFDEDEDEEEDGEVEEAVDPKGGFFRLRR